MHQRRVQPEKRPFRDGMKLLSGARMWERLGPPRGGIAERFKQPAGHQTGPVSSDVPRDGDCGTK